MRDANRTEAPAPAAAAPLIAESKNLSGCAVSLGTFTSSSALLRSVDLSRYETTFEEEAMDPDTLIEVLTQQVRARARAIYSAALARMLPLPRPSPLAAWCMKMRWAVGRARQLLRRL